MNIDLISIIIFIILMILFLYFKRKKISIQKVVFPFLYLLLYRTKFGLRFMNKVSIKYKEIVKFFGYCCIGLGFVGMIFISYSIIATTIKFLVSPKTIDTGVSLVLPGTTIAGIGYLSFWHWIIAIFILAIVHEFSHGIVSEAHNLKVKSSGFAFMSVLIPIIPAAFVEPDEKKIKKQPDHVQYSIFAAGPIANVVLAFIILLITSLIIAPIGNSITDPIGFSFDIKDKTLPAGLAGLESGMIITSFNDEKILTVDDFVKKMDFVKPNEKIILGTKDKKYEVITTTSPTEPEKGFIGVYNLKNEVKFKTSKAGESIFKWTAGLFKWLFLLNLFVGLFNLLPLGIVDGGRMLQVLLHKTVKDKKKANRIWGVISFLILGMLLLGLLGHYLKKFGLF